MAKTVRLGVLQLADLHTLSPRQANPFADDFTPAALEAAIAARLALHDAWLGRAGDAGLDLVVTSEDLTGLADVMMYLDAPALFRRHAATSARQAAALCAARARRHRLHLVACYYEPAGRAIYNVAVLFGRDGAIVGKYRKVHLPAYERWLVSPGDRFPAFATPLGRIGMNICYDQMWPEAAAATALNGADLICMPSAAVPARFRAQARALDCQVFFLSSHAAHSAVIAPNGTVLADAGDATRTLAWADVAVRDATLGRPTFYESLYSGVRDHRERHLKLRRPVAYAPLVAARPPLLAHYGAGGVADSPAAIRRVYAKHKAEMQRLLRGGRGRYDWRW